MKTQEEIYEKYLPLFKKVAYHNHKKNKAFSFDDIVEECFIRTVKLVNDYKDDYKNEKGEYYKDIVEDNERGYVYHYLRLQISRLMKREHTMQLTYNYIDDENKRIKQVKIDNIGKTEEDKESEKFKMPYETVAFDSDYMNSYIDEDIDNIGYERYRLDDILEDSIKNNYMTKIEHALIIDFLNDANSYYEKKDDYVLSKERKITIKIKTVLERIRLKKVVRCNCGAKPKVSK